MANADTCINCGAYVPEGRMVCPACEALGQYDAEQMYKTVVGQIGEAAERIEKESKYIRRRLALINWTGGGLQ